MQQLAVCVTDWGRGYTLDLSRQSGTWQQASAGEKELEQQERIFKFILEKGYAKWKTYAMI